MRKKGKKRVKEDGRWCVYVALRQVSLLWPLTLTLSANICPSFYPPHYPPYIIHRSFPSFPFHFFLGYKGWNWNSKRRDDEKKWWESRREKTRNKENTKLAKGLFSKEEKKTFPGFHGEEAPIRFCPKQGIFFENITFTLWFIIFTSSSRQPAAASFTLICHCSILAHTLIFHLERLLI